MSSIISSLENVLDREMLEQAKPALESGERIQIQTRICNVDRAFGAMLSGVLVKKYGSGGLPDDTITIKATGTAGQSFGAWLAKGIRIELEGEANDYVGKGLSGGKLVIYTPSDTGMEDQRDNIIVGNTVLYGAISGEAYFNGVAGERFCVRNSGVTAVVEGVGDHGCEYMTGGVVVCLGPTGKNFAAGMSGGIAYVLDEDARFALYCNQQMVTLESVDQDHKSENIDNLLEADETRLRQMISTHLACTGSNIAQQVLDDWPTYRSRFIKIVPHEFRQALMKLNEAGGNEPEYMVAQHG
jgi:glutamate synthase (NADPH/NADH) large chain